MAIETYCGDLLTHLVGTVVPLASPLSTSSAQFKLDAVIIVDADGICQPLYHEYYHEHVHVKAYGRGNTGMESNLEIAVRLYKIAHVCI